MEFQAEWGEVAMQRNFPRAGNSYFTGIFCRVVKNQAMMSFYSWNKKEENKKKESEVQWWQKAKKKNGGNILCLENPGIDPGTSRMLSERSTIWANPPNTDEWVANLIFY